MGSFFFKHPQTDTKKNFPKGFEQKKGETRRGGVPPKKGKKEIALFHQGGFLKPEETTPTWLISPKFPSKNRLSFFLPLTQEKQAGQQHFLLMNQELQADQKTQNKKKKLKQDDLFLSNFKKTLWGMKGKRTTPKNQN